jgi:molybdenum cofactor biosynthesis enzyme MoaA
MGFPLRLTADLAFGRAARAMGLRRNDPLILHLDADENVPAASPVVASRIVWIGGAEPLERSETPRMANALAEAGRYVFLSTNGALLRRCIHEFQPSSRLYLTIRFDRAQASHDRRAAQEAAYQAALAGIRTAKLSGFLLCAQLVLHADGDLVELTMLHDELRKLSLDGFLISPAAPCRELARDVADVRRRLLSRRWAQLSRLLDAVALPAQEISRVSRDDVAGLPSVQSNYEESVQAQ